MTEEKAASGEPGDSEAPGPRDPGGEPSVKEALPAPPFPFWRLLIPLAGIALAVWVLLGSVWRWDVTPKRLLEGPPPAGRRTWAGRYVRLRAGGVSEVDRGEGATGLVAAVDPDDRTAKVLVRAERPTSANGAGIFSGRVATVALRKGEETVGRALLVDTTRGRLDGRGVVGLLVGVWGAAILYFNIFLWLRASRRAGLPASSPERHEAANGP